MDVSKIKICVLVKDIKNYETHYNFREHNKNKVKYYNG